MYTHMHNGVCVCVWRCGCSWGDPDTDNVNQVSVICTHYSLRQACVCVPCVPCVPCASVRKRRNHIRGVKLHDVCMRELLCGRWCVRVCVLCVRSGALVSSPHRRRHRIGCVLNTIIMHWAPPHGTTTQERQSCADGTPRLSLNYCRPRERRRGWRNWRSRLLLSGGKLSSAAEWRVCACVLLLARRGHTAAEVSALTVAIF